MSVTFTTIVTMVGVPAAKLLLKRFMGDWSDSAGSLLEIAAKKISGDAEKREAQRQFEALGDKIAQRLLPLFKEVGADISAEAILFEVNITMNNLISARYFVDRDLDPQKITNAILASRSLPRRQFSSAEQALYERIIAEVVRYVIAISEHIPEFTPTAIARILSRLGRIGLDIDKTLERIAEIERKVSEDTNSSKMSRYEADYLQAVVQNLDYLELFGADIRPEAQRHSLSAGYLSLTISAEEECDDDRDLPANLLPAVLRKRARVLLRGHAGSGKSTLVRWLAMDAALNGAWSRETRHSTTLDASRDDPERANDLPDAGDGWLLDADPLQIDHIPRSTLKNQDERIDEGRQVPLLVRLRDCKNGKLPGPQYFPEMIASELGHPPSEWVLTLLREGRALVVFDGIDEVPNAKREDVRAQLSAIISTYPNNGFVVTTRPSAIPEGWLAGLKFKEARLNPLGEIDREEFIGRWHHAVEAELERQGRPDDLSGLATSLVSRLAENPGVARLATNPLLCSVICALHRERHKILPESQSELCEAVCHLLLHRREVEAGLTFDSFPSEYRQLTYDHKRVIVREIAHHMVRNEESSIDQAQAERIVNRVVASLASVRSLDGRVVLKTLVERSGIIRELRPGHVDFLHNTIKDYLASEVFMYDDDISLLAKKSGDDGWRQVILFAAASRAPGSATNLMNKIVELADSDSDKSSSRRMYLTAVNARYSALFLDRDLQSRLQGIERSLIPPRSMSDAEALSGSGDNVASLLKYKASLHARETAACVRALRLIGTPLARKHLEGYLRDVRMTVVQELCQAVNPLRLQRILTDIQVPRGVPLVLRRRIKDISPIKMAKNISRLYLAETIIENLDPLADCLHVKELDISGTRVSSLKGIARLNLRYLDISKTAVADLDPIAQMSEIEELNCAQCPIAVLPVERLTKLSTLNISQTQIRALLPIKSGALRTLSISNTPLDDYAFWRL